MAIIYISTLCTLRAHLKQSEIWRKPVNKRNKTQKTPGRTRARTMWMRTVSCAGSVVLYQIIDVSRLYTYLMDTQEHEKSKAHKLGTERKSTSLASRISDSAVQCQYYHSKFGEVRPEQKSETPRVSIVIQACKEYETHWSYHHSPKRHWSIGCKFVHQRTKTSICVVDGGTR